MASFQDRFIGAIKAQPSTFAEVLSDNSALSQAIIVVVAGAVAGAVGNLLRLGIVFGGPMLIMQPIIALIGWAVACAVLWIVGTKMITGSNKDVALPAVLRTIGFAEAPMIGGIIAIVPWIGPMLAIIPALYCLYTALVATKVTFGYDDFAKAAIALVIAVVVMIVAYSIVGFMLVMLGMGAYMLGGRPI